MDLQIQNKLFLVTGASDGLGLAVSQTLIKEGARIIAVATSNEKLKRLKFKFPGQVEIIQYDLYSTECSTIILKAIEGKQLDGVFINAGGPPAMAFKQTKLEDWDKAYNTVFRWKMNLLIDIIPLFTKQKYGRIILSESISVKQPVPNLVLSNSMRLAVVGAVKTLAAEVAKDNITVNIIGTGYHNTNAMQRLFKNKMVNEKITIEEAVDRFEKEIPVGKMGDPESFGKLITWLLSPLSSFITGQTISVDGGTVKGTFG